MYTRRRGSGDGSIYKRKDGRWAATLELEREETGRRSRKTYYGATRDQVRKNLDDGRWQKEQGLSVPDDRLTVREFLQRWLIEVAEVNVRPSTAVRYRQLIDRHAIPRLGSTRLSRLRPGTLQSLYADKVKHGLAPRTVGHVHRVLHRALRDAVRWGLVTVNVCDAVDPPRVRRTEIRALTPGQARRLLGAAAEDPLEALYVLALTSGLRQGELLALKWADVDLDAGKARIQRTVRRIPGAVIADGRRERGAMVESEPKSLSSNRAVTLTPLAVAALRRHRIRQARARLAASVWEDHDLVFANGAGKHIEPQNVQRRSWLPLLSAAELPRIRFHDLRHTAATLLLTEGVHPRVVQELLGHSSISLTLGTYSHVLPDMQTEAVAKMQALLSRGAATETA